MMMILAAVRWGTGDTVAKLLGADPSLATMSTSRGTLLHVAGEIYCILITVLNREI